jgi:CHAT domain-containing protein
MTRVQKGSVVVLSIAVLVWVELAGRRLLEDDRTRFVRAVRGERPVAGRLSWDFEYAPPGGAAGRRREGDAGERRRIERAIEHATERRATPQNLAARGVVRAFNGQAARAVPDLERAARLVPGDSKVLSDLAVAYLARARQQDDPYDLILALAAADRAVAADNASPAARYNRALALEGLFLLHQAREDWEGYLQLDQQSGWAQEARAHLAGPAPAEVWKDQRTRLDDAVRYGDGEVVAEIVRRFSQEARRYVEEDLLGEWAAAVETRRPGDAERTLGRARVIARALADLRQEHLPEEAVAAVDRALAGKGGVGRPERLAVLVEGHRTYREARQRYGKGDLAGADALFERSRRSFERADSPMARWAAFYRAGVQQRRLRFGAVLDALQPIVQAPENQRYPGLLARAWWTTGMARLANAEPAAALDSYRAALEFAKQAGAAEDIAGVQNVLGEVFDYLGDWRQAWNHHYAALAASPRIGRNTQRLIAIVDAAAEACLQRGEEPASRFFHEEVVRLARESGSPVDLTLALLRKSGTSWHIGEHAQALRGLAEARLHLAEIADPDQRARLEADLLVAESQVLTAGDAASADELDRALAFSRERGNHFLLGRLYLASARAQLARGDLGRAEEDLRRGIGEFERQRQRVPEEELRVSFFGRAQDLFEELVRLQVRMGQREAALDSAERGRARALLDHLGPLAEERERAVAGAIDSLPAAEIRTALPRGVALVEYVLLADRLLAWVVRADGIDLVEKKVDAARLGKLAGRFGADLAGGAPVAALARAANLYDVLLRPLLPRLRGVQTLVFIPDKALHAIPFAALYDRATRRYLVEDRAVAIAPSATFYVEALRRDRELAAQRRGDVLAVGNPRFDRRFAPDLPDLPDAEAEAKALVAAHPGSNLLTGEQATKAAFLAAAGLHEVVHFAGHAVANPDFPLQSYLLLAPAGGTGSGLLFAHELYGRRFARTRLAVLAACSTAAGPASGEGVMSLARGFLAAGVPAVVASLWNVNDRPVEKLLRVFYERLGRGADAAAALRGAQLALLSDPDPDARSATTWAAFELLGGTSALQGH